MDASLPQLPPQLREALAAQGGAPLRILDEETQKLYVLMEETSATFVDDEYLRNGLQEAFDDVAAGRVEPWEIESIKSEGRRILAERQARRNA